MTVRPPQAGIQDADIAFTIKMLKMALTEGADRLSFTTWA